MEPQGKCVKTCDNISFILSANKLSLANFFILQKLSFCIEVNLQMRKQVTKVKVSPYRRDVPKTYKHHTRPRPKNY